ncbi:hydroxymethylbilane synthase [Anaerocolumna sedimenticola]|uniref:Porphobilinogen deaminase n=1 Tax=Anaerocolumna sedimenticola TaxID=2696063 RepID=A0A6P1TQD7_9FIRM|nr:hydroxymethylbilane synthase [Anaerocolumna sedimenticola]QHQ62439.1 hydroxymethylbilane synthase [Anaerocolumna sedimenticola]
MKQYIKIGTRKSKLAMVQTEMVVNAIKKVNTDIEIELVPMTTIGDKVLDKPLESFGGKGAFISEFEDALLTGKIDMAVHSAKDMPISLPKGLSILAVSLREDPRDVLVTRKNCPLPQNGIVGTSSLRRQIQIEELYPVQTKNLRGNVGTRLLKLQNKEYDGIILAAAGLKRLNFQEDKEYDFMYLDEDSFIPAAGQGIIAIEGREEAALQAVLQSFNHMESMYNLETEREVLKLLNAGCSEPVGVYSNIDKDKIILRVIYKYKNKVIRVNGIAKIEERLLLAKKLVNDIINFE